MALAATRPILVTGANKGIGKAICYKLLDEYPDVHVLLGSRNAKRGQQAVAELQQALGADKCRNRLDCIVMDTGSDESVQAAVAQVDRALGSKKEGEAPPLLYGICNNAGALRGVSYDELVNVNYYGPQRVNRAFAPRLQRPGGRIVHMGSGGAPGYHLNSCPSPQFQQQLEKPWTLAGGLDELNHLVEQYDIVAHHGPSAQQEVYGFTKALVHAYTWLLARQEPDLIVNAVTPGWIATDMTAGSSASNTPAQGAIPPVYLLMDDDTIPHQPTGRYYGSDCQRSPWHLYRSPGDPPYDGPDGPP